MMIAASIIGLVAWADCMPLKIIVQETRLLMKITDSLSFGKAIRERRKALGCTQGMIADFTGLSVSFLSDLENGKKTVQLDKALTVAMLLGLDLTLTPREDGAASKS